MHRISRSLAAAALAAALVILAAAPLTAQVTIGGTGQDNCFPFGCQYGDRYQQVYAGSAFSGPLAIGSITFFNGESGFIAPGTYDFGFSTTSKGPSTLDATFADNVGTPLQIFAHLVAAPDAVGGTSFTVTGVPYLFDPALGNLLLDISYTQSGYGSGNIFYVAGGSADVGRVYAYEPEGVNSGLAQNYGLLTQFDAAAVTTTPEPATAGLVAAGLLGVFGVARRRRAD